jgi:hypothetical protein
MTLVVMLKKIVIVLGVVFVLIQFFRPEENLSNDNTYDIATKYQVPEDIAHILEVSCKDCHSNKTRYPLYSKLQPIAWWLNNHIKHGKGHLNYSNFTALPISEQNHLFEETIKMVRDHEMPLPEYTYLGLHPEAKLSEAQRKVIMDWSKAQMNYLKDNYPVDSLVRKRKPKPRSGL